MSDEVGKKSIIRNRRPKMLQLKRVNKKRPRQHISIYEGKPYRSNLLC